MPELPTPDAPLSNLPEFSISEISQAIKRTLEGTFERVRVRGEISGFKRAASGHLYMALKDANAVLDAVCWRGVAGRLAVRPEDGLEVIAVGRITSYPGRSKYQIVIDSLELAGEGALLKLLEERRRKLAAEGLFDAERKRPLPFLPEVIGVVTSPTGAVIRDILHRLADRFPRRVLVWPVLVQGEDAAQQIAAAIAGFNRLAAGGDLPRPDVLIVARGGGSLEDLWAFNEEVVVRAAAASEIPLISAVGHETDTTLIDHAADRRAPTPTAAAEMAVPVRAELLTQVLDLGRRSLAGADRLLVERRTQVEGLARGLPEPRRLLEERGQQLDDRAERLDLAARALINASGARVRELAARIPHPRSRIDHAGQSLGDLAERLAAAAGRLPDEARRSLDGLEAPTRLARAVRRRLDDLVTEVQGLERVLETVSYHSTLKRGFAVVHGPAGVLAAAAEVTPGMALEIEFHDGRSGAVADGGESGARDGGPGKRRRTRPAGRVSGGGSQGTLL